MIDLKNVEDLPKLLENPAILYFSATWCGPCKKMMPLMDKLLEEFDISIIKIDSDDFPELVKQYTVKAVPTLIFFNQVEKNRTTGSQLLEALRKLTRELKNA